MKTFKFIGIILIVLFLIAVGGVAVARIVSPTMPPAPVVISSAINDDQSELTDYVLTVATVVRNDGGPGRIVVEAVLYPGEVRESVREAAVYAEAGAVVEVDIDFPEAKLLSFQPYKVTVWAKEKNNEN